jgi:ABC-type methionine transport system ATPase subunit
MVLAGVASRQTRGRAAELLERVGLGDRRHHTLATLSGGEQQRVAIAVALANHPSILLADEPTGELDTATAALIYDLFQSLNRDLGLTVLIVSHDPLIAHHVHRVMAIRDGKAASETVRARRPPSAGMDGHPHEDHFEELLVLDSAGRLQIPKTYREALKIGGRVRMEMVDGQLVIHPVEEEKVKARPGVTAGEPARQRWWHKWRNGR